MQKETTLEKVLASASFLIALTVLFVGCTIR